MTETTTVTAPTVEARAKLYGALARLQAHLPKVAKGSTADTGTYKYQYAGLDAVTEALMPALGAVGLAFIALPTVNADGKFVLAYSLVHEAGAEISGEYPLMDKGTPQALGSAITYARRYALCAATGVAPGGEDDDAAAASKQEYDYSNARQQGQRQQQPRSERQQGQVSRPARPAAQAQDGTPSVEADPDAQKYADTASQARTVAEVGQIHKDAMEGGKLNSFVKAPESGNLGKLVVYLDWRRKQLADLDKAWKELDDARGAAGMDAVELEVFVKKLTGTDAEAASASQLRQAVAKLRERAA
jgi:hypothetical protein